MKRLIAIAAGLSALGGSALAADLGAAPAPVVPVSAPGYNWGGFYFGFQGGLAGGSFKYPLSLEVPGIPTTISRPGDTVVSGRVKDDAMGGFGGVTAGYNWMLTPNVLLGVETDIAGANIDGSLDISGSATGFGSTGKLDISGGSTVNWFGTTRLRAGWANGPLLLYATGGVAYGEVESSYNLSATGLGSASDSVSSTSTGWTAGAGIEYMVGPRWTVKTEYLYVDLGDESLFSASDFLGAGSSFNLSRDTAFHTLKAGLNYHWGGTGDAGAALAAVPPSDWNGGYVGAFGGLAGGTFDYPASLDLGMTPITAGATVSDDSKGGFGGVAAGYNWQVSPNVVLGVETDIAGADINGSLDISGSAAGPGVSGSLNLEGGSKVNWFGTTRARAGWVTGPLLLYATGGLAYGETESFYNASLTGLGSAKDSVSSTATGWTAGAGAEYQINPHWTLKTEYLYVDLGKETLFSSDDFLGSGSSVDLSRETAFHTVKAGVNYRW